MKCLSFRGRLVRASSGGRISAIGRASAVVVAAVWIGACGGGGEVDPSTPLGEGGHLEVSDGVPRNVVIYLVDTLRASRLGLYGHPRETSPRVDDLAQTGVVFDRAFSSSPWTRTSVVTLFTGLHPESHGVHDREDVAPDSLATLAEAFHEAGYVTAGFSSNISVSRDFNLHQGFDSFKYFPYEQYFAEINRQAPFRPNPGYLPVDLMFPDIADWVKRPKSKPFFLYVHVTDPHYLYVAPHEYMLWGNDLASRYDGEVRFSDEYFGRFMDLLRSEDLLEETLVIFTADHGEELEDRSPRRFEHGHSLYNELLRVPLVMWHRSLPPGRRPGMARLLDIFPTLVEWLDLPSDLDSVQGCSLLPVLRGKRDPAGTRRTLLGQIDYPSKIVGQSLQSEDWKLIYTAHDKFGKEDVWELYHIETDPGEQRDLSAENLAQLESFASRLETLQRWTEQQAVQPALEQPLDEETKRALRALGYIQ